jgi:hypothetical protein
VTDPPRSPSTTGRHERCEGGEVGGVSEVGDFGRAGSADAVGLCRGRSGQRAAGATYAGVSVSDIAEDIADVGSFGEHGSVVDHALPAGDGDQAGDVGASDVGATGAVQGRERS